MATAEPTTAVAERPSPREQLPSLAGPRLPYHPGIQERFGIDKTNWKALVEAVFPNAVSTESVILALSYCRARKLDPFKRNVHIVPIYNKQDRCYHDTIWPGIGELRTTAFRTGEYTGRSDTKFGADVKQKVGTLEITFPEWAQVSVFRTIKGERVEFVGPRVYWLETYAVKKHDDDTPNEMWQTRPRGQIDKCAEAAALRAAFPEEIGGDFIPEEVERGSVRTVDASPKTIAALTEKIQAATEVVEPAAEAEAEPETLPVLTLKEIYTTIAACKTSTEVNECFLRSVAGQSDEDTLTIEQWATERKNELAAKKPKKGELLDKGNATPD
jgi:phage recombination protein Bet